MQEPVNAIQNGLEGALPEGSNFAAMPQVSQRTVETKDNATEP